MTLGHYIRDGENKDHRAEVTNGNLHTAIQAVGDGVEITTPTLIEDRINSGNYWQTGSQWAGVNVFVSREVILATGSLPVHVLNSIGHLGNVAYFLFEAPVTSDDGTSMPIFAKNRSDIQVPETVAFHTPTLISPGEAMTFEFLFEGRIYTDPSKWILAPNTRYLIRAVSLIAANLITIFSRFYEEA